ncbi:amidohydrolase family protein [Mycobacterium avium subsp. avium 2285 (R)]|nr:amidohydrolase family protein [Mycobacterium avium subsp. avium 2285 (R)]
MHFGETEKQPTWMLKVRDDYFKGPASMFAPVELSELIDEMDAQGVRKAILMDNLAKPSVTARKFVEDKPERFALAMGGVNLLRPIPSLRELGAVVADLPVAYAAVGPSFWGMASIRPATPSTIRSTPSAPSSSCRCASTPAFPGPRSRGRCRIRSTSTGSACASRNSSCA